jgi:hypothetical protein
MPQWITFLAFTLVAWLSLTVGVGLLIGRLLSVAAAWRLRRRGPPPRCAHRDATSRASSSSGHRGA